MLPYQIDELAMFSAEQMQRRFVASPQPIQDERDQRYGPALKRPMPSDSFGRRSLGVFPSAITLVPGLAAASPSRLQSGSDWGVREPAADINGPSYPAPPRIFSH